MTNNNYDSLKKIFNDKKIEIIISLVVGFFITILVPFIAIFMSFLTAIFSNKYIELLGISNINFSSTSSGIIQNSFSFNILLATGSIVYILCIAPLLFRNFYYYNKDYLSLGKSKSTKIIISIILFIAFPLITFLLVLFLNELATFLFLLIFFLIVIILYLKISSDKIRLYNGFYNLDFEDRTKYLGISLTYSVFITITFFPFFFIFKAALEYFSLNNIGTDSEIITTVFGLLFLYGILYGSRTIFHSFYEYIIDLLLSFFIIGILYIYTPSILIIPIVEMTGVKDKSANNYEIEKSDFENYLKSSIESLWSYDLESEEPKCNAKIDTNSCSLFMSEMERSEYLIIKLMVIYRDDKQSIICPPDFKLSSLTKPNKNRVQFFKNIELCSVISSDKLLPSTKSTHYLENSGKFRNVYIKTLPSD